MCYHGTRNDAGLSRTGTCGGTVMKKYALPILILAVFEAVAVTLWLTKDNIFYLFNFSYIGLSISLGMVLFIREYKYARRIVQLLVGLYMCAPWTLT